jgi:hypothetical protein
MGDTSSHYIIVIVIGHGLPSSTYYDTIRYDTSYLPTTHNTPVRLFPSHVWKTDEFASALNDCLSDEFTSELNDCLSVDEFIELTDCLLAGTWYRHVEGRSVSPTRLFILQAKPIPVVLLLLSL